MKNELLCIVLYQQNRKSLILRGHEKRKKPKTQEDSLIFERFEHTRETFAGPPDDKMIFFLMKHDTKVPVISSLLFLGIFFQLSKKTEYLCSVWFFLWANFC